jgi:photosystem II stability/assembly factor-like uncharacterized protein
MTRENFRILFFIGTTLLASALGAQSFPAIWESRGIGGGGALMDPSFSPHDDRLFVACDMSELFRSTDLGRHWSATNHAQIQGNRGSKVGFTSNPNILFAIDQTRELPVPAKSLDGGLTWTRASLVAWPESNAALGLFTDRTSTQKILVATYDAVFLSTDGGNSYAQKFSTADAAGVRVAGVFFDGNNIYAGTNQGLLLSTNNANFVVQTNAGIPTDARIIGFAGARTGSNVRLFASTANTADVFAGMLIESAFGSFRGLYRLNMGAANWTAVNAGVSGGDQPLLVAMADNDINQVIAAGAADPAQGEAPVVYRTTDGGNSWSSVLQINNNANVATGWAGSGGDRGWSYGGGLIGMDVAPNNPQRIAVSDYGFVHVSEDGGAHWRQAYVDPRDQHAEGAGTPLRQSYRTSGLENTSVWTLAWSDASHLFAGFSDIRGIRSSDGGVSWSFDYSGHGDNSLYKIARDPNGVLYGATSTAHDLYQSTYLTDARIDGASGRLLRSADGGLSWTTVHNFAHVVAWVALDPNDANRAYAAVAHSSQGGIWTTSNLSAGASSTWTQLPAPPRTQGHAYNVVVLNDGAIVATFSGRRDSAGAFTASSGVFYKASINAAWEDRSDNGMRYWTKDIIIDRRGVQRFWRTFQRLRRFVSQQQSRSKLDPHQRQRPRGILHHRTDQYEPCIYDHRSGRFVDHQQFTRRYTDVHPRQ